MWLKLSNPGFIKPNIEAFERAQKLVMIEHILYFVVYAYMTHSMLILYYLIHIHMHTNHAK